MDWKNNSYFKFAKLRLSWLTWRIAGTGVWKRCATFSIKVVNVSLKTMRENDTWELYRDEIHSVMF